MRAFRPGGPRQWHLPARTLLIAMPVAAAIVAALTRLLTGLPLLAALLVAAVLAPTDPVLVSGLLRRERGPTALRHTLKVESGLNDGLALPAVLVLVLARPLAVLLSLLRTGFDRRQRLAVAWFGPKGLASVIYVAWW